MQSGEYRPAVFGLPPLEQGALEPLLLLGAGDIDLLHGIGVQSGVKHAGRDGTRGRIEILDLFGVNVVALQKDR